MESFGIRRPPAQRVEGVVRLMGEVNDLCIAARTVEVRYPERVRAEIVNRFNELRPMMREVEDQAMELSDTMSEELSAMISAYRRLERLVEAALDALDALGTEVTNLGLEQRLYNDELEDRLERDAQYGRVRRSYDGWRRRP